MQQLLRFDNLEKSVQVHLRRVYSALAMSLIAATAGAYVHLFTNILRASWFLTFFGSLGMLILVYSTPHSVENQGKRLAYFMGFAFFTGLGLGPLLEAVMMMDPTIVPTALLGTSIIFLCFTLSSLWSAQRKWLYLGGILFSCLGWMMMLSLANIFFGSRLLYEINLYLGLGISCAFILYDTQLIVEKKRRGDDDYIWHGIDLFIDFVQLFRYILILLANKDNKKKNNKD